MKHRTARSSAAAGFWAAAFVLCLSAVIGSAPKPTLTPASSPKAASAGTPAPATTPGASASSELPKCADCHTELVEAFVRNPHARVRHGEKKPDPNDACSTCHGDGTKHMEAGGDAALISTLKGLSGSQDCLACHAQTPGPHDSFATGVHSNTEAVNCLTCHSIHKAVPKSEHLLAKAPGALCATCHLNQAASFQNKPYAHRLDRGGMSCLDCHAPHARRGEPVKMTVQGDLPCLSCHADLRGPFVFQHVSGSGGDCMSCHQPHGSANPRMLNRAQGGRASISSASRATPRPGGRRPTGHNPRRSTTSRCRATATARRAMSRCTAPTSRPSF